ncbi:RNA polymerase sigma factor SigZ [Pedobacter fastidiosus]|uniref:RNA polymerase sigma factor SigZ n=1 Tax=Pedobacter fastidiosus TaxID=2765361 RepID=A0ABR7KP66_9SPHI|nr:RNA polymerase sigma factor SigZ [Pedobacter fastidiosus]MBC6109870.1 RNA polymerase sigma factor SigZ [Pedobacter fastidiosus]
MVTEITKIWADFHQELKAFIFNKTRNTVDTDDILQDVFIKIMLNIDRISKAENLRHYLYGIVKNAIADYFRSRKQVIDNPEIEEGFTEEDTQTLNETIANCCIKPFINKLPDNYRDALLITEFQNISQKELASKLNISYSGAKSRVQRGKEKLKALILNCCAYQSDRYGNIIDPENKNCGCS